MNPAPVVNEALAQKFSDGYEAFNMVERRRGHYHQVANPVKKNSVFTHSAYREWERGWNAAYFENLEKQNGLRNRS